MPSFNAIGPDKLARLVGTRACPTIIDVRSEPRELLPGSILRRADDVAEWAGSLGDTPIVVACDNGRELSAGVAALLRCEGVDAEILEGGFEGWRASGAPVIDAAKLPHRDAVGRTLWVTRARPKV